MFGGKSPPSLIITTGAGMAANYVNTPHMGGSVSPSSTTSSSSSSPCPSTPSSSTHTFSMQHNHFQPHQRNGDAIPTVGAACGTGWNGDKKQQKIMQKRGRGTGNWQMPPFGNFMPRGPPFGHPPFPPPPHGMFFPPPPFMNGPPPPFFPPPPYSSSGMPVDTSMPPPPYSMGPPPFFMGFPPPPPPSFFHSGPNGSNNGRTGMQQQPQQPQPQQQQQSQSQSEHESSESSRPSSREGGGSSLASTELSDGEHSDGSYETASEDEDFAPSPDVNMGKRSYLINLRPKGKREEPGTTPPPIGDKEFDTFISILTKGSKGVKETDIMDTFIVEYMKNM